MGILKVLGQGQGYLKAGFLGFQKSGKSYTATLLSIAVKRLMEADGPIVMHDTESGSEYLAPLVRELTGQELLGVRSQSFSDLLATGDECLKVGASVLIVDSMTHIWRELCESHLESINKSRSQKRLPRRHSLEFQDWGPIKRTWAKWTDFYLNSPLHIVICGRAGFEYDFETNAETNKRELVKTGVKMKTESEFGFEPSLLVEMERESRLEGKRRIIRRATVIGDRFSVLDGKTCEFVTHDGQAAAEKNLEQVFKFFRPHLDLLKPGAHAPIDTALKSDTGVDEEGEDRLQKSRRERVIFCEEIQAELVRRWPSQSQHDKFCKSQVIYEVFHTGSWTKVESLPTEALRQGLEKIRTTDWEGFFASMQAQEGVA